jgi:hypothetical protein
MYHWSGDHPRIVSNAQEEAALGNGWASNSRAFAPYKGPRRIRTEQQIPTKWLAEWGVPGMSPELKKKIAAQLLRAEVAFDRSLDPDAGALVAMRQAFDGIAKVLFDAGILTADLLRKDIYDFVWDAAIAGAWWRLASESRTRLFPEPVGHYWIWRDDNPAALGLFRAEIMLWEAELLEAPSPKAEGKVVSESQPPTPAHTPPIDKDSPLSVDRSDPSPDFASESGRGVAMAAYKKFWSTDESSCSEAALARTALVDPADLSKWKKGSLPADSEKKARIERALRSNEKPTPVPTRPTD